ncbi:hypothetical protein B0J18DRAFT_372913 [Chaetomium sp. MPI-SDFR-AT-0129]|nr:hypothetical protein B0J18DRAFT_372913 [Chaetomium sp. MPI-SDFR-AT-0129]
MADKYLLRVTAGPTYDISTHVEVPVNSPGPSSSSSSSAPSAPSSGPSGSETGSVRITSNLIEADLCVRINKYRGLPRGAPSSSVYFETEPHKSNGDQYSIAVRFRLLDPGGASSVQEGSAEDRAEGSEGEKKPGIPASDLQWGNDFDHPLRSRLPPGFNTALNIVKWWIDPGLDGNPYADHPYLYGPALSSFNTIHVGPGKDDPARGGLWFEEGGDEEGLEWRRRIGGGGGVPGEGRARMKWALKEGSKEGWTWEFGRVYGVDFFNPYVDFGELALRLPGFNLPVIKYWDGQGLRTPPKRSHQLRYVLRNRTTGQVYLVVLFTLHLAEDINEDGTLKPAALEALAQSSGGQGMLEGEKGLLPVRRGGDESEVDLEPDEEDFDEEQALGEARRKLSGVDITGGVETREDDVD